MVRGTEYFGNIWSGGPNISDIFGPAGPEIGGTDYAVTGQFRNNCAIISTILVCHILFSLSKYNCMSSFIP